MEKRLSELSNRSEIIQQAARAAGEAIRKAVPTEGVIEKEGRANLVTAADLASEKAIVDIIRSNFPSDSILSEETASDIKDPLTVAKLWVIDPIDGTSNFRYQRNYCAVSIGYIEDGVMQIGATYNPFADELFFAEKGKGAFLNGSRIAVSDLSDLTKATVATDNSYDPEGTKRNIELLLMIKPTPWALIKGSAVLTMSETAAGRFDLYFHSVLKPWDNAAAFLIAEEAGAKIKDLNGNEVNFMTNNAVVGNERLVEQFLQAIKS